MSVSGAYDFVGKNDIEKEAQIGFVSKAQISDVIKCGKAPKDIVVPIAQRHF